MRPETLAETCRATRSTANLFRLGMQGRANATLIDLVDGLTELLADAPVEQAGPVGALLSEVVAAQERGDVLRVADLLEFELLPYLEPRRGQR